MNQAQPIEKSVAQNGFFDRLRTELQCRSDRALSQKLRIQPPSLSKMRSGVLPIGATLLVNAHEESNISIKELKSLIVSHPS